jgi:hypothetical protein
MRPSKEKIARGIEELEERVGVDVCRCGVGHVPGARSIVAAYEDDDGGATCPTCGHERIVVLLAGQRPA